MSFVAFVSYIVPCWCFYRKLVCSRTRLDGLRRSLGFPNGMGVGSQGRGGGLALLWSDVVCVMLQSYDKLHIDVVIGGEVAADWFLWQVQKGAEI